MYEEDDVMKTIRGNVWVFGDDLDVDMEVVPYRQVKNLPGYPNVSEEEMGKLAFTLVDPDFPKKVKKGDIVVAGTNMGCGHDHATGPRAIIASGVAAVVAESLHEWFLRNCILLGLPAISYEGIKKKVKEGDELEIDFASGKMTNVTTGVTMEFEPVPEYLLKIIEAGNLTTYLKNKIDAGELETYLE